MSSGFKFTDTALGWSNADFDDAFVKKDCFLEGGLWAWGPDNSGVLGTNARISRSSPVQTISGGTNWRSVDIGSNIMAAVKTDGTLWLWGTNFAGSLGTNNAISRSSPTQTVSGGTNWQSVSVGGLDAATAAIKTDGTLWVWGCNFNGQLGRNNLVTVSSPVQTIAGGTNWKRVCTSGCTLVATKTDGTLWMWGTNPAGVLGTNDQIARSSPVQTVSGGTDWCTAVTGLFTTAAIKCDSTLWLWGCNRYGELGTDNRIDRSSPVQTVAGGTNWRSVSLSYKHVASIKADGTLWLWGRNVSGGLQCASGNLGTNDGVNRSSPVQTVAGGTNWKSVSTGCTISTAIKTDGTLWMWGYNAFGALGTNDLISRSSPVQTVAGGTNWRTTRAFQVVSTIREDYW
jgi:alpha-tubulin suppressor-like RCC1 family protein